MRTSRLGRPRGHRGLEQVGLGGRGDDRYDDPVTSVSIELSHACQGCGQPVAVNAVLSRVRCDRCGRSAELDARIWRLVLDEPLREGPDLSAREERTSALVTDAGRFQLVYRRGRGSCSRCQAPITREQARAAASGYVHHCACGMRTPCRVMPPEVGLDLVELLREEDPALLWPDERTEAVTLKCNGCGGAQEVGAATTRIFSCRYCAVQCFVPDDLWSLLHPVRAIQPWVLELRDDARERPTKKRSARKGEGAGDPTRLPAFSDVKDLVVGSDGTLYAVLELESTGEPALFALDAEGGVRWRKEIPASHRDDPRLSFMPSGHVVLWCAGARALFGIRGSDGVTEAEVGADRSVKGALDLRKASSLACDVDGTIVVGLTESSGVRLVRYTAAGAPAPLWPGLAAPTPWDPDAAPALLEDGGNRILGAQDVLCAVGFDGVLYVAGDQALAAFDREGNRRFVIVDAQLAVTSDGPTAGKVFADRGGRVFTFEAGPTVRRYEGGGRGERYLHADGAKGLLSDETVVAVGPDGTVWAGGADSVLRRFGPARTLEWASRGARRADRERGEE